MNSKLLVFILFAVWSGICWRWYVCGIKGACDDNRKAAAEAIVRTPAIERDTVVSQVIQPAETGKPTVRTSPSATSIDRVQMEDLKDRVVIHFPYSSTRKEDNDAIDDYLTQLAQYLVSSGGSVTISGHTDFVSDSKTNYQYGLRRAYGIRDILVRKGVKKSQIRCKSFGESKPVATNDTAPGRYKNRRAEIRVSDK